MTKNNAKLIILRGPSGAGKSTIAKALQTQSARKVAVIEQDHYKEEIFANDKKGSGDVRRIMLVIDCLIALESGYDVILEGIMSMANYGACFDQLFSRHPEENYMFYMDVSFEESVKRHTQRDKNTLFGEQEMKEWYELSQKSGYDIEISIPERYDAASSADLIRQKTKL